MNCKHFTKPSLFLRILIALLVVCNSSMAQVRPKEKSQLHYRIIGFEIPAASVKTNTMLEIAKGIYDDPAGFAEHIISRTACTGSRTVIEVPDFGADYTWRVTNGEPTQPAEYHHFTTLASPNSDINSNRLRITQAATAHKDAYIFCDRFRTLSDMNGKPVWFLPEIKGVVPATGVLRDLKMTPQGTITFISESKVAEISWDAEVLWTAPDDGRVSGDTTERYHHEFTRLHNGNYMVLGSETKDIKMDLVALKKRPQAGMEPPPPPQPDQPVPPPLGNPQGVPVPPRPQAMRNQIPSGQLSADGRSVKCIFGNVIEYDRAKKVVWSWHSYPYHMQHDIAEMGGVTRPLDTHENSFYFDEKKKFVYVGFKNASQILKVQYPRGTVVASYGKKYKAIRLDTAKAFFCDQHAVKLSSKGYLYMFNNNLCNLDKPFQMVMLQEPVAGNTLKKVWAYDCPIDWSVQRGGKRTEVTSGGNAQELRDHSMFISACAPFAGQYLVDVNGTLLWQATAETKNHLGAWELAPMYRASMLEDRKQLERLIWQRSE